VAARTCRRCALGEPHVFRHGTKHSFQYHGCRCLECRVGARAQCQRWRAANPDKVKKGSHHTPEQRIDYYRRNVGQFRRDSKKQSDKFNRAVGNPSRRSWTPGEDSTVLREDISILEIAYILGRNRGSIMYRRAALRNARAVTS